jgi:hypothetical protein
MDDKEPFLARWSRRKLETKEEAPAGVANAPESRSVAPAVPLAQAAEPPLPELAAPDTPEYRELFDPQVDETLRRTALKKLFSDPHFNVMDGLDTYIDDYSKPDPIPEAMLRQLNQAKDLFLFDDETKPDAGAADGAKAAGEPAPAALADANAPASPVVAGVPGADAAPATVATPAPEGSKNG